MKTEILFLSKDFKQMSTEELRTYMDEHQDDETGELAFIEYSSRPFSVFIS